MAMLFVDGCDLYGRASNVDKKWDMHLGSFSRTDGRFGTGTILNSGDAEITRTTFDTATTAIVGASMYVENEFPSDQDFIRLLDGGSIQVQLRVDGAGRIVAQRGTTTIATSTERLKLNRWFRLEVKLEVDNGAGTVDVEVDGVSFISFAGDTQETGNASVDQLDLGSAAVEITRWDDIIIMDDTGSTNNDFVGDINVETLIPNDDGLLAQFDAVGIGTTNSDRVNDGFDGPDFNLAYVESSVAGAIDRYRFQNLATVNIDSILATQKTACLAKTDDGAIFARLNLLSGVTLDESPDLTLSTTYKYFSRIRETDPDTGVAWLKLAVNAISAGPRVV